MKMIIRMIITIIKGVKMKMIIRMIITIIKSVKMRMIIRMIKLMRVRIIKE